MQATSLPEYKDVPWRWIAYATSTFLVGAIAFGFVHQVELKQDVPSEIVSPAEVKIRGMTGLVSAIYAKPNEHVAVGAPLFRLQRDFSLAANGLRRQAFDEQTRDEQIRGAVDQYEQRRAQLNAQLESSRVTEASRRAEIGSLDEQIAQNGQLVHESESKLTRLRSVSDYVTADRIEQAQAEVHQSKVAVAQIAARRQQLTGEVEETRSARAGLDAQMRELMARHSAEIRDIRSRYERERQDTTVSAPQSGVIKFSSLVTGRMLTEDDVALVIATSDNGALRAALRIPSRRRGFVKEGQTVRLKFDAFPYVKFGTYEATIDSISETTVGTGASSDQQGKGASSDGEYMAWVTLRGKTFDFDGQHFAILPGMRATASIVVERRTIAEWVLAPLFRMLRS
ncbi:secretion protein [Caballeronia glebae]|jgi:membrane fusion protein|uniref:Secretion protein n=1 Tax=Caballeronia glebae TaxID=1777143 RepID=A0A157Z6K0_9BURK|nr:HlyD family efflux transporter periplasmic adaptor subunit [Caballeronia glebae]SAK41171.1 secretion protein [Caballeronia glebae]